MKLPKKTKRYCKFCKKRTEQKIKQMSTGIKRGTLKRGAKQRAKLRGLGRGIGNKGKWGSRPANPKHKRKTKTNKKPNILFTCSECGKSLNWHNAKRVSKVVIE